MGKLIGLTFFFSLFSAAAYGQAATDQVGLRHLRGSIHVMDGTGDTVIVSTGPDGVLMVDGGSSDKVPQIHRQIATLGHGGPRVLLNTHWHHAFANASYPEATIIAQRNLVARLRKPNFMFASLIPAFADEAQPDVAFDTSHSLDFNGERIDIMHLPQAHTDSDAIVIFRDSNVVATGDVFVPHLSWIDYAAGGNLTGFLAALDRLVEIVPRDALLVPGHGPVSRYGDLLEFRAVVGEVVQWVRTRRAAGESLFQIQEATPPEHWSRWAGGVPLGLTIESIYKGLNDAAEGSACEFVNGRWFDGQTFVPGAGWYSVDGFLTRSRPRSVECAIDLQDRYILPPLADAHTHNFGTVDSFDRVGSAWLRSGIFYAMVQDPMHEVTQELRARASRADGLEAALTSGVITPTWSAVAHLYQTLTERARVQEPDRPVDYVITLVDTQQDLERQWNAVTARNDRFLKVILAFSEEFDHRKGNPAYQGTSRPGLDPDLLSGLTQRADAAGLKVSVHVETANDFRLAVAAGADYIAHLPGWQVGERAGFAPGNLTPWLLTEEDARNAARQDVSVITTAAHEGSEPSVHHHNLSLLRAAGTRIILGSDSFDQAAVGATVVDELLAVQHLGVFTSQELLRLATETTAAAIFPDRRIGRFDEGYESTFIAYDVNPLEQIEVIRSPVIRVKRGRRLD